MSKSVLQKFYADKTIFITGATEFLGIILVEKILRSCPEVKKIFIILTSKNGNKTKQQITEFFDSEIFDLLKKHVPNYRTKVCAITGNLITQNLGLKDNDANLLRENVNIVFHVGATETSHNILDAAGNVIETKNLLNFLKNMKNLIACIHVSTAFCNYSRHFVDERIYSDNPISPEKLLKIVESTDNRSMDHISPDFIEIYGNTCLFMKQVSEQLVAEYWNALPIGIIRPSIVSSTHSEPIPGWIKEHEGPVTITLGILKGFCKIVRGDPLANCHFVPVDLTTNCMLAAAWDVANTKRDEIPIYNFTSNSNNLNWKTFSSFITSNKYPLECTLLHPWVVIVPIFMPLYNFIIYLFHGNLAILLYIISGILGQKSDVFQQYKILQKTLIKQSLFIIKHWDFKSKNIDDLWNKLSSVDKEVFNFNIKSVDWDKYLDAFAKGLKVYVCKEDMKNIKVAENRRKVVEKIHQIKLICILIIFIFIVTIGIYKIFFN